MPIYEYRCQGCGQREAVFLRRFSEAETSLMRCANCGSGSMSRLISRVSIVTSERARIKDVSWIDRNLAGRLKGKAGGKISPGIEVDSSDQ